jgi:hypothetical protein
MKYWAILFFIVLSGCVVRYQIPVSTDTATIELRMDSFKVMDKIIVQVFEDEKCTASPRGTRFAYFFMDMYDSKKGVIKAIAADKEFVFTHALGNVNSCVVTAKFTPSAGGKYISYFGGVGGRTTKCFVSLEESYIKENGEKDVRPVPSFKMLGKSCMNHFNG